jgi:hypothetical protein
MWMSERLREREKSLNFFLCMHSHIDIVLQPLGFITNGNLWCSCWDIIDLYYPRVLVWDHIFQQYLSFDWNALYYACYSIKKRQKTKFNFNVSVVWCVCCAFYAMWCLLVISFSFYIMRFPSLFVILMKNYKKGNWNKNHGSTKRK